MTTSSGRLSHLILFAVIACHLAIGATGRPLEPKASGSGRPVVSTIKSPDGDTIDCVDMNKQPAFDNPLLKNHTIQMFPEGHPENGKKSQKTPTKKKWGSCPEGTIPILRTQKLDASPSFANDPPKGSDYTTDWAVAVNSDGPYVGASGNIYVMAPHAEPPDVSINFLSISKLDDNAQVVVRILAGWIVYPAAFSDSKSRLFISLHYGNENTSCINLGCSGFVQAKGDHLLGDILEPTSKYADSKHQYALDVHMYRDASSKWWIEVVGEPVGYFPPEVVPYLEFDVVMWGGRVSIYDKGTHETPTQMGNGHFPKEGVTRSGYIEDARVLKKDGGDAVQLPSFLSATRSECYDFENLGEGDDTHPGYRFLYGGPGCSV